MGKTGEAGTTAAFQIWVNDKDAGDLRSRYMSIFYPGKGASYASRAMHNIRLVDDSAPSLRISSLGEVDVLESLRHVLKWYSIDPDQICLGGHSMGGNGTWDLASKHTNLFACLAPKAGRSSDDCYENFRHLPALIQHGAKDGSQPVDFGRYTASRLKQLGFSVIYKEFPEDGHGIRKPYPVEEWLVKQRRPRSPEIITYSCDTAMQGEAYWARIRRFMDPHRPATIDARVTDAAGEQRVALDLRNVEVIEFNLEELPSDRSRPLFLAAGESEIRVEAPQPERITLVFKEGRWGAVESWAPPVGERRPYLPGGAGNLYSGDPLLIVYPTEGKEETRGPMEAAARSIVLFGGFGDDMITGRVPIKADREVTESDIRHRNLILFGGPEYNVVTRKLADGLPVTVNDRDEFVVEGHDPVDVDQSALILTTDNPIAPKRLIHVVWQDEIPAETRERFVKSAKYRLPGASGRYPHNIPDLQISSLEWATLIRRQFTYGWELKPREGMDMKPSPQAIEEGTPVKQLRLMRKKTKADYAIGPGGGGWGNPGAEPPTLEEFRYRNYRIITFKADIEGKQLAGILSDPAYRNLVSYPPLGEGEFEPGKTYSIVAPESILWLVKPILKARTNLEAGPDVLKSDLVREIYGVDE